MSRFDKTTNINIEDIDIEKLRAEVEADRQARKAKKNIFLKKEDEPEIKEEIKVKEIQKEPEEVLEEPLKKKKDSLDQYVDELLAETEIDNNEQLEEDLKQEDSSLNKVEGLQDIVKNDFQEKIKLAWPQIIEDIN